MSVTYGSGSKFTQQYFVVFSLLILFSVVCRFIVYVVW